MRQLIGGRLRVRIGNGDRVEEEGDSVALNGVQQEQEEVES